MSDDRTPAGRRAHHRPVLDRHRTTAGTAGWALGSGLDVHAQRLARVVDDPEHPHRRQSHQQLAHARRVNFHRGSPELDGLVTIKFAEPLLRSGDAQTPLISEAPHFLPAAGIGRRLGTCWTRDSSPPTTVRRAPEHPSCRRHQSVRAQLPNASGVVSDLCTTATEMFFAIRAAPSMRQRWRSDAQSVRQVGSRGP